LAAFIIKPDNKAVAIVVACLLKRREGENLKEHLLGVNEAQRNVAESL
jgi:hypothetical protein